MRKLIIAIIVLIAVTAGGTIAIVGTFEGRADGGDEPVAPGPVRAPDLVTADAVVEPHRKATLTLTVGRKVADVLVQTGDVVEEGQVLVRLDDSQERAAVLQARSNLERAQAALLKAQTGPTDADIRAAQAAVAAAQGRLQQLAPDPGSVAEAEAAVRAAEAELARVQAGPDEAEIVQARTAMENAAREVQQAQFFYDQIGWRGDREASQEALRLEAATRDYEAAQARYEQVVAGPRVEDVQAAQARVDQQKAALERVRQGGDAGSRNAAAAEVQRAQAQLDALLAGSSAEDIAMARADVSSAEANLEQAEAALRDTEIRAPFAGTVALINVAPGEQVNPESSVIRIGDLSRWVIRTDDLTELAVGRITEGDRATIRIDAIPGLELTGHVQRIGGFGETRLGDIVYDVWIIPDAMDPRLRWNMTANVVIDVGE